MNERITERIVRTHLDRAIKDENLKIRYWEQIPDDKRIKKLLANASKQGRGRGRPEFIVSFDEYQDFLVIVECKADIAKHESGDRNSPSTFAVDGVLHYSKHLAQDFNVLSIAVSGTDKKSLRVSHFFQFKKDGVAEDADDLFKANLQQIGDYLTAYLEHGKLLNQDLGKLLLFTQELNKQLHLLKVKEANRSLLISAILMALRDSSFVNSYEKSQSPAWLLRRIKSTMLESMEKTGIQTETYKGIEATYGFMDVPGQLGKGRVLINLIKDIDSQINSFKRTHDYYDFLGQLYIEFLRYSNSDRGLGIVLTPPHVTDLTVRLVDVGKDDVLYDNCAGTGGFLISGMKRMIKDAGRDSEKIKDIKQSGLVGIEIQPDIASLCFSNMFIHGDGKSNVFQGDCFDSSMTMKIESDYKPTVGFLNPPYKSDRKEMEFVLNNMSMLRPRGRCVALLPMQCALAQKGEMHALKEILMEKHTLEAVLSLPDDLFHNSGVGVVTCLMVFTAHQPHPKEKETWFAYCKDDGFVKRKPQGRIDHYNTWNKIRDDWVGAFHNRKSLAGFSVMKQVSSHDEWCAEAFIETDYEKMTKDEFVSTMKKFVAYKFLSGDDFEPQIKPHSSNEVRLPSAGEWRQFEISELFSIQGTKTTKLDELKGHGEGKYPYVTTQAINNGVAGHYDFFTESGGVITVDSAVLGFTSYQPYNFSASDHVEKLIPKFKMNAQVAMFIVTVLNKDQFRYNYGRKASQTRIKAREIRLPSRPCGSPDFQLMEDYIKSLPFSSSI